jgi:hypothetical protein
MLSKTRDRVPSHTSRRVNQEIRQRTLMNVRKHAARGAADIERRLMDLDREWDIERALEANAATAALVGVGLAALVDRRFLLLPAAVAGFLLQHALQGWCPPVPILRRSGFRTAEEIATERYALKALRGDFNDFGPDSMDGGVDQAESALEAAR